MQHKSMKDYMTYKQRGIELGFYAELPRWSYKALFIVMVLVVVVAPIIDKLGG